MAAENRRYSDRSDRDSALDRGLQIDKPTGIDESSGIGRASARKKPCVITARLLNVKNSVVAQALGKDESWVNKIENGSCGVLLEDLSTLLDCLGLKVVSTSTCSVDKELVEAMIVMHEKTAPLVRDVLLNGGE